LRALREAFATAAVAPAASGDDILFTNTQQYWTFQQGSHIKKARYKWDENDASPVSIYVRLKRVGIPPIRHHNPQVNTVGFETNVVYTY